MEGGLAALAAAAPNMRTSSKLLIQLHFQQTTRELTGSRRLRLLQICESPKDLRQELLEAVARCVNKSSNLYRVTADSTRVSSVRRGSFQSPGTPNREEGGQDQKPRTEWSSPISAPGHCVFFIMPMQRSATPGRIGAHAQESPVRQACPRFCQGQGREKCTCLRSPRAAQGLGARLCD